MDATMPPGNFYRAPFSLEQVRTFLAVAELEHVTRAAARIHLSQGAVTEQVQLLERVLGVALFERVGRGVALTDAGRRLVVDAGALLRAAESFEETARSLAGAEIGSVVVGSSQTAAAHYLPSRLRRFQDAHPGVELRVVTGNTADICARVALGAIDLGLVEGAVPVGLRAVAVASDELVVVAAPDHALHARKRLRVADLVAHLYLAREAGSGTESAARKLLGDPYSQLRRIELGQLDAIRSAAIAGVGFAVLPRIAVKNEIAAGLLAPLPIGGVAREILAVRRSTPGGAALEAFWNFLSTPERS
ncbi:MAG: LysR family transcriptional regulator [Candidatus Dormibacteria bacterium]